MNTENYDNLSHCPIHGEYYSGTKLRMTREGKEITGSATCPTCLEENVSLTGDAPVEDPLQSAPSDKALRAISMKYFALMVVCMRVSGALAEAAVVQKFAAEGNPDEYNRILAEVQRDYEKVLAKARSKICE